MKLLRRLNSRTLSLALLLTILAAGCASPTPTPTAAPAFDDAAVRRASLVAKMWGHLEASAGNARAGDWGRAAAHAAHPVGEYWALVEGRLADAGLAETVRSALDGHARAVGAQDSDWEEAFRTASAVLRRATEEMAGPAWDDPAFRAAVLRELLEAVEEEYAEAVEGERIADMEEYQDSWGFFRLGQQFYSSIAQDVEAGSAEAAHEIEEKMEALEAVFATVTPALAPAPVGDVKEAGEVRAELAKALELAVGPTGGPEAVVADIREMMEKSLREYADGETNEAYEYAADAYLEGFEHIEGDLIQNGHREMVEDLEIQFKELRDGVQAGRSLDDLQTLVAAIEVGLDRALEELR